MRRVRIEALSRERERERERERVKFRHTYNDIISTDNLLIAWQEFLNGKRRRHDVAEFSLHLADNIFDLHRQLMSKTYRHGPYHAFKITDPKQREIHKATVSDRLVHHALYGVLYPYFGRLFISDSYSCQKNKGTHKAINRFRRFAWKASRNNTKTVWVLKGDVKKFFASIDHALLKKILARYIVDKNILWLLAQIIDSFETPGKSQVGLPLGNLTSQLFINIYMNDFDQFVKHKLRAKYYVRYADDFVILSGNKIYLEEIIPKIANFLKRELKLTLHPDKLYLKTLASGVDFLGWVHFPKYRVLRTASKRRMLKKLKRKRNEKSIASYLGLLKHGNTYKLAEVLLKSEL